jgi:hypothetical protein
MVCSLRRIRPAHFAGYQLPAGYHWLAHWKDNIYGLGEIRPNLLTITRNKQ